MPCTICGQIGHNKELALKIMNNQMDQMIQQFQEMVINQVGYNNFLKLMNQILNQQILLINHHQEIINNQNIIINNQNIIINNQEIKNTEYTEQQRLEFKTISDNTDNFKLKQLPKCYCIKIYLNSFY